MKTHEEILEKITGKSPQYLKQNFLTFNQCIEAMNKAQIEVKNYNILVVLKELIELVKDMKFSTDCGGELNKEECQKCKEYYKCCNTYEHREKCENLLNSLKKI
jgi:hypothetical protein